MKNNIFKATVIVLINLIILTGCESKEKEETKSIVENNGMLSYTIDGEIAKEKPTKESGYFVNSIKCDKGSILVWDNDNWQVELTDLKGSDRCIIDFTKDTYKEGYRVTAKSNMDGVLDSYSKATINGGQVEIYTKSRIEVKSVTGCLGTIENNKVAISNITQNQICNIEIAPTLANYIKLAYTPQEGRTDFSKTPEEIEMGLYTGTDDQGTTYYFSGNGTNMKNWVKFAGKWWRIIRINGNGSVRLLYAGDGSSANDIGKTAFNNTGDPIYVGWKYGTSGSLANNRTNENSSAIYTYIFDNWYSKLSGEDKNYIDTEAIYCNDRNLASGSEYSTSSELHYAATERLEIKKAPTFTCSNSSDRFTTFGLMTVDEVVYGGNKIFNDNPLAYYCLAKDGKSSITGKEYWWTMTPLNFYYNGSINGSIPAVFDVSYSGNAGVGMTDNDETIVRPVISLRPEVIAIGGDGSANSPYEVSL